MTSIERSFPFSAFRTPFFMDPEVGRSSPSKTPLKAPVIQKAPENVNDATRNLKWGVEMNVSKAKEVFAKKKAALGAYLVTGDMNGKNPADVKEAMQALMVMSGAHFSANFFREFGHNARAVDTLMKMKSDVTGNQPKNMPLLFAPFNEFRESLRQTFAGKDLRKMGNEEFSRTIRLFDAMKSNSVSLENFLARYRNAAYMNSAGSKVNGVIGDAASTLKAANFLESLSLPGNGKKKQEFERELLKNGEVRKNFMSYWKATLGVRGIRDELMARGPAAKATLDYIDTLYSKGTASEKPEDRAARSVDIIRARRFLLEESIGKHNIDFGNQIITLYKELKKVKESGEDTFAITTKIDNLSARYRKAENDIAAESKAIDPATSDAFLVASSKYQLFHNRQAVFATLFIPMVESKAWEESRSNFVGKTMDLFGNDVVARAKSEQENFEGMMDDVFQGRSIRMSRYNKELKKNVSQDESVYLQDFCKQSTAINLGSFSDHVRRLIARNKWGLTPAVLRREWGDMTDQVLVRMNKIAWDGFQVSDKTLTKEQLNMFRKAVEATSKEGFQTLASIDTKATKNIFEKIHANPKLAHISEAAVGNFLISLRRTPTLQSGYEAYLTMVGDTKDSQARRTEFISLFHEIRGWCGARENSIKTNLKKHGMENPSTTIALLPGISEFMSIMGRDKTLAKDVKSFGVLVNNTTLGELWIHSSDTKKNKGAQILLILEKIQKSPEIYNLINGNPRTRALFVGIQQFAATSKEAMLSSATGRVKAAPTKKTFQNADREAQNEYNTTASSLASKAIASMNARTKSADIVGAMSIPEKPLESDSGLKGWSSRGGKSSEIASGAGYSHSGDGISSWRGWRRIIESSAVSQSTHRIDMNDGEKNVFMALKPGEKYQFDGAPGITVKRDSNGSVMIGEWRVERKQTRALNSAIKMLDSMGIMALLPQLQTLLTRAGKNMLSDRRLEGEEQKLFLSTIGNVFLQGKDQEEFMKKTEIADPKERMKHCANFINPVGGNNRLIESIKTLGWYDEKTGMLHGDGAEKAIIAGATKKSGTTARIITA